MNSISKLIDKHLHEGLTEAEDVQALAAWIRADPRHARSFARDAFVHRHVGDAMRGQSSLDGIHRQAWFRSRRKIAWAASAFAAVAAVLIFFLTPVSLPAPSRLNKTPARAEAISSDYALRDPDLLVWLAIDRSRSNDLASSQRSSEAVRLFNRSLVNDASGNDVPAPSPGGSLTFKRHGDGLPLVVDGTFDEVTLAARVRLDAEPAGTQRHRGMLMSTGWGSPGQIHWQVKGSDFRLSIFGRGNDEDPRYAASPDAISVAGWHHFASVVRLRGPRRGVEHYLDGVLVSRQAIDRADAPSIRIGPATLGGWVPPAGREGQDRSLNGAMDDVAIFRRALSPEEVRILASTASNTDKRQR